MLKQIGLTQIMAQCGSFIPASNATLNLKRQILSRAGEGYDKLDESSFEHEMLEMKYILENLGTDSLILIDELCRSTNFNEGLALSLAVCEFILARVNENFYKHGRSIFVYYASHYKEISCLEYLYPKITGFYLESFFDKKCRFKHSFKLNKGYCEEENYGIN